MTSEDRYTFSQVVSTLVELQSVVAELYKASAESVESSDLRELLLTFAKSSQEGIESLTRVRRETVIEMSLEPITGLRLDDQRLSVKQIIADQNLDHRHKAIALEQIVQDLCNKTSEKVAYISADTSELLKRLSEESSNRKSRLLSRE